MPSKKSDSIRKELGNKLKEARKKLGLTQAEVAEAAEYQLLCPY